MNFLLHVLTTELLQVVVPTLITACLTNEKEERSGTADSSKILPLLQQLTVDADPLLYDYIRVCFICSVSNCIFIGSCALFFSLFA